MASLRPLLRSTSSTICKCCREDLSELLVLSLPEKKRIYICMFVLLKTTIGWQKDRPCMHRLSFSAQDSQNRVPSSLLLVLHPPRQPAASSLRQNGPPLHTWVTSVSGMA